MSYSDFKTRGVRIGSLFAIGIWVHWLLLLLVAYYFYDLYVDRASGPRDFGILATHLFATFVIILLHELGHCYAAFRVGGGANAIVLWPLGGLAYCDAPRTPPAQFWVAAGGPLVNVAVAIVVGLLLMFTPLGPKSGGALWSFRASYSDGFVTHFLVGLFDWNLVLLIFNLLPVYPLDGGRMLQAVLWGRSGSFGQASLRTVWVTRVTLVVVIVLALLGPLGNYFWFALMIGVYAYWHSEQLRLSLMNADEGGAFGYDFSRGHTSLDRTMPSRPERPKKPSFLERRRLKKARKERERAVQIRARVDDLLEKISREGMQSLSPEERRFLEEASKGLG